MGVSKNNGTPQIINFNRVFHHKPSILGYPYFWKHSHLVAPNRFVEIFGTRFFIKKSRELHLQQALARHLGGGGLSEHKPSSFLSKIVWLLSRDFKSDFTNMKGDIFWESS